MTWSSLRTYVRFVCDPAHTTEIPPTNLEACTVGDMERRRIDALLAERGLAGSRTSAAASVRAGNVRIGHDGQVATKPGQLVRSEEHTSELQSREKIVCRLLLE